MAVKRRNNPVQIFKPKRSLVGYSTGLSKIKSVEFPKGYITVVLNDGTRVSRPIKNYPGIQRLSLKERRNVHVSGGVAVDFDAAPEVYHITDFIGGSISDYE